MRFLFKVSKKSGCSSVPSRSNYSSAKVCCSLVRTISTQRSCTELSPTKPFSEAERVRINPDFV